MISKERFLQIEYEIESKRGFGCGYWNVCDDHGCACPLSSKGFDKESYASMEKQQEKDMENFEREFNEFQWD